MTCRRNDRREAHEATTVISLPQLAFCIWLALLPLAGSTALAQEVPEDFGNPWMANLTEIGLPEPVPWRPPAPGWYALAVLAVVGLSWFGWRLLRRWRANAYRREALTELGEIKALINSDLNALSALPTLLKRTALVAYPRVEVASLTSERWLGFLDRTIDATEFSQGPGRLMLDLAYSPDPTENMRRADAEELMALARRWIRRHRASSPVPFNRAAETNTKNRPAIPEA